MARRESNIRSHARALAVSPAFTSYIHLQASPCPHTSLTSYNNRRLYIINVLEQLDGMLVAVHDEQPSAEDLKPHEVSCYAP